MLRIPLINIADLFGFRSLNQTKQIKLFLDLVIARIVETESKLQSLLNLQRDFAINHQTNFISQFKAFFHIKRWEVKLRIIEVAKSYFGWRCWVIKTLKSSFNSVIINKSTNQQIILESAISDDIKKILQQLNTNLSNLKCPKFGRNGS